MKSNGGDENSTGGLARESYEKQEWLGLGGLLGLESLTLDGSGMILSETRDILDNP